MLIASLSQEPELNQWIEDVFNTNQDDVKDELARNCSLIKNKKIDNMEKAVSAKADAITSFIKSRQDSNRLKKVYEKLLEGKNKELLLKVKLNNGTVKRALNTLGSWFSRDEIITFDKDEKSGSIAKLKKFIANWKNQVTNDKAPVSMAASLGYFIWCFSSKLEKDDFNELLNLDIWDLGENQLYAYGLCNILRKIEDGGISDEFLNKINENKSVDFSNLWNSEDKCFGRCLFKTIYELIRTSEGYDPKDPGKQKAAIKKVLENGEEYQWFRDGLQTFFIDAKYEKDKKYMTAKDINPGDIFKVLPDLQKLLDNCGMKLNFECDKNNLENS